MVILGRFNAQVTNSAKHSYELRRFCFEGDWEQTLSTSEKYVRTMDQLLNRFFVEGIFTEENVKRRLEALKNGSRSVLNNFGAYSDRLRSTFLFSFKLNIQLLDSIEKLLKFDWDSLYVSSHCDTFIELIELNNGRDLPIVRLEEITQVFLDTFLITSTRKNFSMTFFLVKVFYSFF